jgi:uncharacterized membrane protein
VKQKNKSKKNAKGGIALGIINKPTDVVWTYLEDAEAFPEFIPHVLSTKRYQRKGDEIALKYTVKVLYKKITYHILEHHDKKNSIISWRIDKSKKNDINETSGRWELKTFGDDKTLVAYTVRVDTGLYVPQAIENMLASSDLPGVLTALKKRVESGGDYSK